MQETQILTCRSVSVLAVPATYRPMSASDKWASSGMSGFRTILPLGLSLNAVVSLQSLPAAGLFRHAGVTAGSVATARYRAMLVAAVHVTSATTPGKKP